jgi:hypothetical protein
MHILITGDPVDGFAYRGPFNAPSDAAEWAGRHATDTTWWVAPLYPAADPLTDGQLDAIVEAYVRLVRANTSASYDATGAVLAALDGTGPDTEWEVVMEMAECADSIGITAPDYDDEPDALDAFNNRLATRLPAVRAALTGGAL